MPSTAIISPQIIDSTQIGRDLITAASQAAAQATIGVTPFDVDADHDWGGFNTFEFLATFEGGINTTAITSAANIVTTMPSGGQGQYYFGANPIYLMSATEFRPAEVGTSASLGSDARRWTGVYGVDGNFSGDITLDGRLGTTSGANITGFGTSAGYLRFFGNIITYWNNSSFIVGTNKTFIPSSDGNSSVGIDGKRFGAVYSVAGSFSGNLVNEVGGSIRHYGLGTESDTDTEFLNIAWDTNTYYIEPKQTGSGANRNVYLQAGNRAAGIKVKTNGVDLVAGGTNFAVGTSAISTNRKIFPLTNNTIDLGVTTNRWSIIYSVDGDFSGTVTSETVTSGVGNLSLQRKGADAIIIGGSFIQTYHEVRPASSNSYSSGTDTLRWSNTYSVDGSFTGNLTSEVGGSIRLYDLGTDGDADTEFFSVSYEDNGFGANRAVVETLATGAGAGRTLALRAANNIIDLRSDVDYMMRIRKNFGITCNEDIQPNASGTRDCGTSALRWSTVFGVDGSFSGSLTTGGIRTAIGGTLSASVTLTTADHTILGDCQLNNISVNLPSAVGIDGQIFVIKKVDATANFITVFASGAETIDGGSLHIINTQNESIHVQAYSGDWYII